MIPKEKWNGLDSILRIIVLILLLLQKGTLKANNYIKMKNKLNEKISFKTLLNQIKANKK